MNIRLNIFKKIMNLCYVYVIFIINILFFYVWYKKMKSMWLSIIKYIVFLYILIESWGFVFLLVLYCIV